MKHSIGVNQALGYDLGDFVEDWLNVVLGESFQITVSWSNPTAAWEPFRNQMFLKLRQHGLIFPVLGNVSPYLQLLMSWPNPIVHLLRHHDMHLLLQICSSLEEGKQEIYLRLDFLSHIEQEIRVLPEFAFLLIGEDVLPTCSVLFPPLKVFLQHIPPERRTDPSG